jgi:hypothetical protein
MDLATSAMTFPRMVTSRALVMAIPCRPLRWKRERTTATCLLAYPRLSPCPDEEMYTKSPYTSEAWTLSNST